MPRWWEEKQGKLLTKLRANRTYSSIDLTNKHVQVVDITFHLNNLKLRGKRHANTIYFQKTRPGARKCDPKP